MRSVFVQRPEAAEAARRGAGVRGWVWVWLPVVFALGVIAVESTATFSAANTSSWLRPVFERFLGHIDDRVWEFAHHAMRKSGHFFGYGMVCLTGVRAWLLVLAKRAAMTVRRWWWQGNGLAVLSTAVIASLDEIHQSFLPSRTGRVQDVLIDTAGGVVVSGMVWGVAWVVRRRVRGTRVAVA